MRLLDVQATDTGIAQLAHRRATLPEHGVISTLSAERAAAAADLIKAQTAVSDLESDTSRAERDLEPVRDRLTRNEKRIADGTIADPKALSGLIEEVAHLHRRIGELEDQELELMEQLEQAGRDRDACQARVAEIDTRLAELTATRDAKVAKLAAQTAELARERAGLVPDVPADLLALYGKLAASHGGVGAAELKARRCTGCQLEVNAADLRVIAAAPADEVLRCEECGRIQVRTSASGI
ncbi:MAG: zinc ribbon domain-containing protein [Propionibacteriaceae bacterium]